MRECCLCGSPTYNIRFFFCSKCYKEWGQPYSNTPWIKYLVANEQKRFRQEKESQNDISLEDINL